MGKPNNKYYLTYVYNSYFVDIGKIIMYSVTHKFPNNCLYCSFGDDTGMNCEKMIIILIRS